MRTTWIIIVGVVILTILAMSSCNQQDEPVYYDPELIGNWVINDRDPKSYIGYNDGIHVSIAGIDSVLEQSNSITAPYTQTVEGMYTYSYFDIASGEIQTNVTRYQILDVLQNGKTIQVLDISNARYIRFDGNIAPLK